MLAGYTLEKLGTGLTYPFLVVYLHSVRGLSLGLAGLLLAAASAAGAAAVPFSGWLADRVGGRLTVILALVISAAGAVVLAMASGGAAALGAFLLLGVGGSGMWNALASLLAAVVPSSRRADVFGVAFALQQLGLGVGAAIGGAVVNVGDGRTFVGVFIAQALLALAFAAMLTMSGKVGRPGIETEAVVTETAATGQTAAAGKRSGYLAVLGDRGLLGVVLLNGVLAVVSAAFIDTAFPAWATGPARATTAVVGAAYSVSTFVTIALQLFVLRYALAGRRRTRSIAASGLLFAAAPLGALVAARFGGGTLTAALLVGALMATGLANTLLQPSLYALVNDLAPDTLRGRYNAAFNLAWQAGAVLGPAIAGAALGAGRGGPLLTGIAMACGLLALLAVRMEKVFPTAVNRG